MGTELPASEEWLSQNQKMLNKLTNERSDSQACQAVEPTICNRGQASNIHTMVKKCHLYLKVANSSLVGHKVYSTGKIHKWYSKL